MSFLASWWMEPLSRSINVPQKKRKPILPITERTNVCVKPVAHQAGAYPCFCRMKRLGVFLLPPGWDASPSQVTSRNLLAFPTIRQYPFIPVGGERQCESENNTMSPARARVRTARSRDQRVKRETTASPTRTEKASSLKYLLRLY